MRKKFSVSILGVTAALTLPNPAKAQFSPDFNGPATVDQAIFAGWVPPVLTGPGLGEQDCYAKEHKNNICVAGGYDLEDPRFWIKTEPEPFDPLEIKNENRKREQRNKGDKFGRQQSWKFNESLIYARAHMWKEALASLNAQVPIWYSSPYMYLLRADIEAGLGRNDLAGRDYEAAVFWTRNSRDIKPTWPINVRVHGTAARWALRNGRLDDAAQWLASAQTSGGLLNTTTRGAFQSLPVDVERARLLASASPVGTRPERMAVLDRAFSQDVSGDPEQAALYREAVRIGYRAQDARQRLVTVAELQGDFAGAAQLRASDSSLKSTNLPKSWLSPQHRCAIPLPMLEKAVATGYMLETTAFLWGDYLSLCRRDKEAAVAFRQAYDAGKKEGKSDDALTETTRRLAMSLGAIGEYNEALVYYIPVLRTYQNRYGTGHESFRNEMDAAFALMVKAEANHSLNLTESQASQYLTFGRAIAETRQAEADRAALAKVYREALEQELAAYEALIEDCRTHPEKLTAEGMGGMANSNAIGKAATNAVTCAKAGQRARELSDRLNKL